jgi:hypothetical protein
LANVSLLCYWGVRAKAQFLQTRLNHPPQYTIKEKKSAEDRKRHSINVATSGSTDKGSVFKGLTGNLKFYRKGRQRGIEVCQCETSS